MDKLELEARTLQFSITLISFLRKIPKDTINRNIIFQLSKSGTSIGANYREANSAESIKDFKHKINISLKEATESVYWLKILLASNPRFQVEVSGLLDEAEQLTRIFGKIVSTCLSKIENSK